MRAFKFGCPILFPNLHYPPAVCQCSYFRVLGYMHIWCFHYCICLLLTAELWDVLLFDSPGVTFIYLACFKTWSLLHTSQQLCKMPFSIFPHKETCLDNLLVPSVPDPSILLLQFGLVSLLWQNAYFEVPCIPFSFVLMEHVWKLFYFFLLKVCLDKLVH